MNTDDRQIRSQSTGDGMAMPPCSPGDTDSGIGNDLSLAMVYSPKQYWRNLFEPEDALREGTLFRELDFPFLGEKAGDRE